MQSDLISRSELIRRIEAGDGKPEIFDGYDLVLWMEQCIKDAPPVLIDTSNHLFKLEELKKMKTGSWLWIGCIYNPEQPAASYTAKVSAYYKKQDDFSNGRAFCCGYPGISYAFDFKDYGKTWVAYRHEKKNWI